MCKTKTVLLQKLCFPNCRIILCSGHIARNHEKHLERLAKQRSFKRSQIKKYRKTHPDIATVKCQCMKDDIGCFTNGFIKAAWINFSAIVKSVGCDQQAFIDQFYSLAMNGMVGNVSFTI